MIKASVYAIHRLSILVLSKYVASKKATLYNLERAILMVVKLIECTKIPIDYARFMELHESKLKL